MRISPFRQVCAALAAGLSMFDAGCGNPASQSLVSLSVTATPNSLSVGGASVLKATAHLSDGTTQDVSSGTQWTVSDSNLASVSNSTMMAKGSGTVTLQAAYLEVAPAGSSPASTTAAPTTISTSTQVTISAAGTTNVPTLTWPAPAAVAYGTDLSSTQLDTSAGVPGTFVYTPAAGTILAAGTQTLSVTFVPTDTKAYSAATSTVQLVVNPAPGQTKPILTWATPAAISYGTTLSGTQLNARSNVTGTFTYTPAAGMVLPAGTQTLSTTFTPTDTIAYSAATSTVHLVVNPAAPIPAAGKVTITWATLAAIPYGTALSSSQLNAKASVAGTFVYTPGAGTVLKAGTQTLSATFTPTDTSTYSTTAANITLTVNQGTPAVAWATPSAITTGTALTTAQLNATASVAGSFAYTPGAGTVLTAGTQTLAVVFTPTDAIDYASATAHATRTVTGAAPANPRPTRCCPRPPVVAAPQST